ncbi:Ohr family peroxiredoxin [Jatrophihabitans endophyticus]|uniref:Ohr family peroxiredoxin n=1 Tax=Jatrophihabitans endophyticus TaxID=1206085 RepID=UPI0019EECFDF|nr:Ohr family peroxiredoxin [Jatrophihabitans endophyticus]MBE7189650.1 Ohr family peroxiredoxin [Jatrophihabitans endophyticus]
MEALYTAEARSLGSGRIGSVRTTDGAVDLILAPPKAFGGVGTGTNPEQLFAAGYAACFHSAVLGAARAEGVQADGSSVTARVSIGRIDANAYGLQVDLVVLLPHVERGTARLLTEIAHRNCPYSNATRGNVVVAITVAG